jgi:TolC family type I secretion outer membrane protein
MNLQRNAMAAVFAAACLAGPAGPCLAAPIEAELKQLLVDHPLLKSGRRAVDAAGSNRGAAQAGYYPRVTVSADGGPEKISTESYSNGTVTPPAQSDLQRRKLVLSVEQNLYAGGRTDAAVDVADIDAQLQANNLQTTTQDVLLEGITAYLQMARYKALITLARRNEETTKRQLALEDIRVKRGGGIAVDAMQARARLQLVSERRVFYYQGLREAAANYEQVFGHAPDLDQLEQLEVYADRMPESLDAALAHGRLASTRVKESVLQSNRALQQIRQEKSGMMPTIDLVASRTRDNDANALARRAESSLLLKFSWPLYSGFETQHRVAAAGSQHQAVFEREAAVRNKQDESVRVAWNQMQSGQERDGMLESAAAITFDVMQNRKRLRDAGRETVMSVLDAEVEYYGVLANRVNAVNDTRIASYRLLAAMGALTPEAIGLESGKFTLPVKPLVVDFGNIDADANAADR